MRYVYGLTAALLLGGTAIAISSHEPLDAQPAQNDNIQAVAAPHGAPASFADMVERLQPAVVNISTRQRVQARRNPLDDLFGNFFGTPRGSDGPQIQEGTSLGAGFLIAADGYIVTNNHVVSPGDPTATVEAITVTMNEIVILIASVALMSGLLWLVHNTKIGTAMRATAENQKVAGLMGIDINKIIAITFAIGSGLGAIAGVMVASNYGQAHYYMGFMLGLKAFTAAVMGGIGNLWGAMVGGLILGLVENVGLIFVRGDYKDIFAFVVLVLVLIFRPQGLIGERVAKRA